MTLTIPVWLLWLVGVPLALIVLFFAGLGVATIYYMGKRR